MFGISNTVLSYIAAAVIALFGAGYAGYQTWKSGSPPKQAEAPATPAAPGAPAAEGGQSAAAPPPIAAAPTPALRAGNAPPPVAGAKPADAKPAEPPQFDVVRVEPTGDAVVAGRAAPNSKVVLLNKGLEIARGLADANGQFVILPPPLPPGDHLLALGLEHPDGKTESTQNVTVSVPQKGGTETLVALTAPNQPTRILSDPGKPAAAGGAAPAAPTNSSGAAGSGATSTADVSIRTVEADDAGGFYATGTARPGATVQLYLNDALVATIKAGEDRQWSLKIERGMTGGAYRVRADVIDPQKGDVLARAEVPFDYPERRVVALPSPAPVPPVRPSELPAVQGVGGAAPAPGSTTAAASAPATVGASAANAGSVPPASAAANAVVAEVQTVTVTRGDNLWRISRKVLGQGMRYTQLYEANLAQIRNPRLIYPNQIFVVPAATPN